MSDSLEDLCRIEEMLLNKMQQRTPARMSEDTYICKTFRYHDLGNLGVCDFARFKKALTPFSSGVTEDALQAIFDRYAPSGSLNYKQFAVEFVTGTRRSPDPDDGDDEIYESAEEIITRLKNFIYANGPYAVIGLAMAFRNADPMNKRTMGVDQFHRTLAGYFQGSECLIDYEHSEQIFTAFRQMYSPMQMAYDEFFLALKEELSQERRAAIRAAFRRLDSGCEGLVDIAHVVNSFNASRHPFVSDGSRDASDIMQEFSETLQDLVAFRRGQRSFPTNLVAWEEFEDYYKFISGCYETDQLFVNILHKTWDIDKTPDMSIDTRASMAAPAAGVPPKTRAGLHHWQENTLPASTTFRSVETRVDVDEILTRLRKTVGKRGLRGGVDVVRRFVAADDDVDDLVDVYEFRSACQDCQLTLQNEEEDRIFETFGEASEVPRTPVPLAPGMPPPRTPTKIRLSQFLKALHGDLNDARRQLVEQVYDSLHPKVEVEEGGELAVSPATLRETFCPDQHPLVTKGTADPQAVMSEFLDTFSILAHVLGTCQGGLVTRDDFLSYYEVVSSTVDNDAFFDLCLRRLWALPVVKNGGQTMPPRRAVPSYEGAPSPMAERRPPPHSGQSAYSQGGGQSGDPRENEAHRRYCRAREPVSQTAPTYSPITKSHIIFNDAVSSEVNSICSRLRQNLSRRGLKGWKSIIEHFGKYDYKRNGSIMRLDYDRLQRSMGLGLSPEDRDALYRALSANKKDGSMDYTACLHYVKGQMPASRQERVSALFETLRGRDGAHDSCVAADTLTGNFNASSSPQCIIGKKTAADVQREWCEAVQFFCSDDVFDYDQFVDFFATVSSIHDEEDEFRLMTSAVFNLPVVA